MNVTDESRSEQLQTALLPVATGALLGCALPPIGWTYVVWVALIPLGLSFTRSSGSKSYYAGVYLGGLLFGLAMFQWLPSCNHQNESWGPFTLAWLVAGHLGGLLLMTTTWLGRRFVRWTHWPLALSLPVIWVGFDLACDATAALLCQSTVPFIQLGVTLAEQMTILQIADLVGTPGLTLLIVAVNGAFCDLVTNRGVVLENKRIARRLIPATVVGGAVLFALGYGTWRLSYTAAADGPSVCLMSEDDLPPFASNHAFSNPSRVPDLLIWSEEVYHHPIVDTRHGLAMDGDIPTDIRPVSASAEREPLGGKALPPEKPNAQESLATAAQSTGAALLMGCRRETTENGTSAVYNSLAFATPSAGYVGHWDKRHLVPWTEFMPYLDSRGSNSNEGRFIAGQTTNVFSLRRRGAGKEYHFGCAICYDVCYPDVFRAGQSMTDPSPAIDFYVQAGSEKQDRSTVLPSIMLSMARLRAVEFRRPIIRNVTGGASGVVDGNGRLLALEPGVGENKAPAIIEVPLDRRNSVYSKTGDIPLFTLWAILLISPLSRRLRIKNGP